MAVIRMGWLRSLPSSSPNTESPDGTGVHGITEKTVFGDSHQGITHTAELGQL